MNSTESATCKASAPCREPRQSQAIEKTPTTFYGHLHAHDVDSILKISCMIILFDHKKKEYLQTNEVIPLTVFL